MHVRALAGLMLLAVACGDGASPPSDGGSHPSDSGSPPDAGAVCGDGQPQSADARLLSGRLSYDRVPIGAAGLDYANTVRKPIRGARVTAHAGGVQVASAHSDDSGNYQLSWTGLRTVTLRIQAATDDPVISEENDTQADAPYVLEACVDAAAQPTTDLHAASGWGGSAYNTPRAAAPFAILDTLYGASHAFLAERPVPFEPLRVAWSAARSGGTYYDDVEKRIHLLGVEDNDTDEFDQFLVVHEWGHFLIATMARADDLDAPFGGAHGPGMVQDPRICWNEGWATAVAAMTLYPDRVYRDSFGARQAQTAFDFDLETDSNGTLDAHPGWFSEGSVSHILYDLFDPPSVDEPFDTLSLSLGEIYDLLTGPQRETEAFATIFSFLSAVKTTRPELAAQVDQISARYGVGPVADAWGSGEPNAGGFVGLLPVYHRPELNGPPLTLDLSASGNDVSRFAVFLGDGGAVSVSAAGAAGEVLLLQAFHAGVLLASGTRRTDGSYRIEGFATQAGRTYTLAVSQLGGAPQVTLRLTRP